MCAAGNWPWQLGSFQWRFFPFPSAAVWSSAFSSLGSDQRQSLVAVQCVVCPRHVSFAGCTLCSVPAAPQPSVNPSSGRWGWEQGPVQQCLGALCWPPPNCTFSPAYYPETVCPLGLEIIPGLNHPYCYTSLAANFIYNLQLPYSLITADTWYLLLHLRLQNSFHSNSCLCTP